jgi:hypothetical protein
MPYLQEDENYHIRPDQIDLNRKWSYNMILFFNTFGHYETERAAEWVVKFCQARGNWNPFTAEEITEFCRLNGHDGRYTFYYLETGQFIYKFPDNKFAIHTEFINRCYKKSPADKEPDTD